MTGLGDAGLLDRLRQELAQKTDEVAILRQVSSRINATLNLEQIQEILQVARL